MFSPNFVKKKKLDILQHYSGANDLDSHVNISYYHLPKEQIILWKQNIKP